jgi:hexosaminidase
MNIFFKILFFTATNLFFSCNFFTLKMGDFKLLPTPQNFQINGVSNLQTEDILFFYNPNKKNLPPGSGFLGNIKRVDVKENAQLIFTIDPSIKIKDEGYILKILNEKIIIKAKDKAGLIYGLASLEQLMEDSEEQAVNLPLCEIKDYPLLTYRPIHLDLKHHRETLEYYYDLIDELKKYKINGIIAEVEDKIEYKRESLIGSSDAFSINDWQKLSEYAKERNISISPLVQGLGHASFVLKHEQYKDLRDDLESDWAFNPLDTKTYKVQYNLYEDALEALPHGKYLHVGGDEVKTTGRNSGKSALELQLMWLNKVCKFAEEKGRIPIFWDDMLLKQVGVYRPMFQPERSKKEVDSIWNKNEYKIKEFLPLLPKNCVYMRWNYHTPEAYGNTKAIQWYRDNGLQVMGATAGQTRWVLMPQREGNLKQIRDFAMSSIKTGLEGLLLTLWDDDSPHFELYKRSIIGFANDTWSGGKISITEFKKAYRQRVYSIRVATPEFAFIDQLETPVAEWKNILLKGNKRNYLMKMENPYEEGLIELPKLKNQGYWTEKFKDRIKLAENMILSCDSISSKIKQMQRMASRNKYSLEIYERVNELVGFTPKLLLLLKLFDQAQNEEQRIIASAKISFLKKEFFNLRDRFEETYSKTRIIHKPKDYILDQDHHHHLANQMHSFDWQFTAELLMFEKISDQLKVYRQNETDN